MSNELPWSERVNAISVNPEMATVHDIARMAAELQEYRIAEILAKRNQNPPREQAGKEQ